MVNFAKIARTTSHAIGDVGAHTGSTVKKVVTATGVIGTIGIGGITWKAYNWVSDNGNSILIAGAVVALIVLRKR
jgi:hypothetical protein